MAQVYWGVLITTLFLSYLAQMNPKSRFTRTGEIITRPDPVFAFILSVILITVAGLRHGVGTDYWAYYRTRVVDWQTVWKAFIQYKEPGIRLLSKLTRNLWDSGTGLILLTSLITVGVYCLMIYRYSAMYMVSMLIFLFLGDWAGSFNGVRQYLAAAVLFAGHRFMLERKLIPYVLTILLASLFHTTALVMIIPYFLYSRKPDWKQFALLAAGAIIIRFSYDLVFYLIEGYKGRPVNFFDEYITRSINPLRIAVGFVPVLLYFLTCDTQSLNEEQSFYINGLFFNAFAMLAASGSAYLGRIGIYTGAMATIGYGHMFQLIPEERNRNFTMITVLFVLFLYWLYSLWGDSFQWIFSR